MSYKGRHRKCPDLPPVRSYPALPYPSNNSDYCAGPNQAWHCDGYDKLKPFGLAIHGCIDG